MHYTEEQYAELMRKQSKRKQTYDEMHRQKPKTGGESLAKPKGKAKQAGEKKTKQKGKLGVVTIIVDDIPPSNNKFLGRNNRFGYEKYKKEWALLISLAFGKRHKIPFEKATVHIHYTFPTRARRDPDNYSGKLILDPLVALGIIADDSFKCIDLVLSAGYEKGVKRTVIEIKEEENDTLS